MLGGREPDRNRHVPPCIMSVNTVHAAHPDGVDAVLDLVNGPDAIRGGAEFLKRGGSLVSTTYAADEGWFADRQITAHNVKGPRVPRNRRKG